MGIPNPYKIRGEWSRGFDSFTPHCKSLQIISGKEQNYEQRRNSRSGDCEGSISRTFGTIHNGDQHRGAIQFVPSCESTGLRSIEAVVFGDGSQGAKFFSDLIPNAVTILLNKHPEIQLNIIHQVSQNEISRIKKIYEDLKINSIISEFFPDIYKYYEACNLVISRSGATTIAELTQIGQPAIFIPLPHASDDHQYYNAKAIQKLGGSWCYRQKDISPKLLADKLYELIQNTDLIKTASIAILNRKKHSSKKFIDTALKIIT